MEEQDQLRRELSDIATEISQVSALAESAKDAELGRYYRENVLMLRKKELMLREKELMLRKEKLLLLEQLGRAASAAGLGVESGSGAAGGLGPGSTGASVSVPVVPYVGVSAEGMNARTYRTCRSHTVSSLLAQVQRLGAVLIKAPPQSGKTSLLQLCKMAAKPDGPFSDVGFVSMAGFRKGINFDQVLRQALPERWQNIWEASPQASLASSPSQGREVADGSSSRLALLLIDEAQMLYGNGDDPLWHKVKILQQGHTGVKLRIVMAAMYGNHPSGTGQSAPVPSLPPTPVTFVTEALVTLQPTCDNGQPSLALSKEEYQELVCNFNAMLVAGDGFQDDELKDHVFALTAGQVGMVTCILDLIGSKVRNQPAEPGLVDRAARHVLNSESLYNALGDQRSFIDLNTLSQYRDMLAAVLAGGDALSEQEVQKAERLVRMGLLVKEGGKFTFASPLHDQYYLVQVYRGRMSSMSGSMVDFDSFIKQSVQRMSSKALRESHSRGARAGARVYERHYQMEWYKGATSYLPKSFSVAPDVGAVFGTNGYLDFWVGLPSGKGWGIELLCNGGKADEHAERFAKGGRYKNIPMEAYALIDFREQSSHRLPGALPNFYHVTFNSEFTKAEVNAGGSCSTLKLAE